MLWPRLTIFLEIFKIQSKIHQRFSDQNFLTPLTILKSQKTITCMLYYAWVSHYCMLYHYITIAQYSTIPLYSRIASLLLSLWLSDMSRLECTWLSLCADGATACRLDETRRNTRELTNHFYGWPARASVHGTEMGSKACWTRFKQIQSWAASSWHTN